MTEGKTRPSTLRSALGLLSLRLLLEQIALALIVFLLVVLWLRVPDASALDVACSVALALLVIAAAGAGESTLMLRLAARERTPVRLLRGVLWLAVGAMLWLAWSALLDHLHANDPLRAGYFNSRFPHQLRNIFSYAHILLWLGWMWTTLNWFGAGVIAIFVFAWTVGCRPMRAAGCALRSIAYWVALVLGAAAATAITGSLVDWTPGHGLRIEMMSLALRLAAAVLVDAVIVCLLLAILAVCARRSDEAHSAPAGTPDESQPRTAENP